MEKLESCCKIAKTMMESVEIHKYDGGRKFTGKLLNRYNRYRSVG